MGPTDRSTNQPTDRYARQPTDITSRLPAINLKTTTSDFITYYNFITSFFTTSRNWPNTILNARGPTNRAKYRANWTHLIRNVWKTLFCPNKKVWLFLLYVNCYKTILIDDSTASQNVGVIKQMTYYFLFPYFLLNYYTMCFRPNQINNQFIFQDLKKKIIFYLNLRKLFQDGRQINF